MGRKCEMSFCANRQGKNVGKSFYCFPRDPKRCMQWVQACCSDELLTKFSNEGPESVRKLKICEDHFHSASFRSVLQPAKGAREPNSTDRARDRGTSMIFPEEVEYAEEAASEAAMEFEEVEYLEDAAMEVEFEEVQYLEEAAIEGEFPEEDYLKETAMEIDFENVEYLEETAMVEELEEVNQETAMVGEFEGMNREEGDTPGEVRLNVEFLGKTAMVEELEEVNREKGDTPGEVRLNVEYLEEMAMVEEIEEVNQETAMVGEFEGMNREEGDTPGEVRFIDDIDDDVEYTSTSAETGNISADFKDLFENEKKEKTKLRESIRELKKSLRKSDRKSAWRLAANQKYRLKNKFLKGQIKRLQQQHTADTKLAKLVRNNPVLHNSLLNSTKKPKGRRYNDQAKKFALGAYLAGPSAYRFVQRSKIINLPCKMSIKRWTSDVLMKPGINKAIVNRLGSKAKNFTKREKAVTVSIDGMSIKAELTYNAKSDTFVGFPDDGKVRKYENNNPLVLATEAVVAMVSGITKLDKKHWKTSNESKTSNGSKRFKQAIGYVLVHHTIGSQGQISVKAYARFFDQLFDVFNCRNSNNPAKPYRGAITKHSCHWPFLENAEELLANMYYTSKDCFDIKKAEEESKKLTKKQRKPNYLGGFIGNINGTKWLSNKLEEDFDCDCLCCNYLCQDCNENLFSEIRRRCGRNDAPNAFQFAAAFKYAAISASEELSEGTNCEPDQATPLCIENDLASEDNPASQKRGIFKYKFEPLKNETVLTPREMNGLAYILGAVVRKLRHKKCIQQLTILQEEANNDLNSIYRFCRLKNATCYPGSNLFKIGLLAFKAYKQKFTKFLHQNRRNVKSRLKVSTMTSKEMFALTVFRH